MPVCAGGMAAAVQYSARPVSTRPATSRALLITAFAVIYLVWGSTFLAVRLAVESLPPFAVAATRNLAAGAMLVGIALAGGAVPTAPALARAASIGGLMFVVNHGGISWAAQRIASGVVALLVATIPLWIVLLEWLMGLKTRPTARALSGLVIGFVGTVLLLWPAGGTPRIDPLGALASTCAAVAWAAGTVATRRYPVADSTWLSAGLPMLCGGLLLAAVSSALGEWRAVPVPIPPVALAAVAYLIVLGSLLGFSAYVFLLRRVAASRVATYAYVNPVVALAIGAGLGGERVDLLTVGAGLLSLLGVFLVVSD
jgi:drug/metabolite transporter (DMT)-like permease